MSLLLLIIYMDLVVKALNGGVMGGVKGVEVDVDQVGVSKGRTLNGA